MYLSVCIYLQVLGVLKFDFIHVGSSWWDCFDNAPVVDHVILVFLPTGLYLLLFLYNVFCHPRKNLTISTSDLCVNCKNFEGFNLSLSILGGFVLAYFGGRKSLKNRVLFLIVNHKKGRKCIKWMS